MNIYAVIKGRDLNSIKSINIVQSEREANEEAEEVKSNGRDAGVFSSKLELNSICDHKKWSKINTQEDMETLLKCHECNSWIVMTNKGDCIEIKKINLEDDQCPACEGDLELYNSEIKNCVNCGGYIVDGEFISNTAFNKLSEVDREIELNNNGPLKNENGALEEGKEL